MHPFKCLCAWLQRVCKNNDLLEKAAARPGCARDLGISVSRIRLPSGEEIMLVEQVREPEQAEDADKSS